MDGINGKKVLVTGASGFVGRHLVKALHDKGNCEVVTARYNLTMQDSANNLLYDYEPNTIIHLAATCGGIGANQKAPGRFFYDNMAMGMNILEAARKIGTEKVVMLGSVCSYPKFCPTPFKEEDIWNGYPEETNAPYGIAKKALLTMSQAYREQYGTNIIYLIPVNLYGPGDNFNLDTSHVIPALIRKVAAAKREGKDLEVWGTGKAGREFLYVKDAVDGIITATEKYDEAYPVNLGTGFEIPIKDLVYIICVEMEFNGKVVWNSDKPDGQPHRRLDTYQARDLFGWESKTGLIPGLRETIKWYYENSSSIEQL